MESTRLLLLSGIILLAVSALLGFVQERHREGLIAAAWAFFLGPLSRALNQPLVARWINTVGAIVALPTYLLLPTLLA